MQTQTSTPQIYVACLASYVSGRLHGRWIDATDARVMREEIQEMLGKSPEPGAEEYAIHDTDGFGSYTVGEYESLDTVATIAAGIAEHGESFAYWADDHDPDTFTDHYAGAWESFREYADQYAELTFPELETGTGIACYFDWDAYARDLEMDHSHFRDSQGTVHVFHD